MTTAKPDVDLRAFIRDGAITTIDIFDVAAHFGHSCTPSYGHYTNS